MIHAQDTKAVLAVAPALVKGATATASVIDTNGFEYLTVYALLGDTDVKLSALKLTESDTENSGYTDVPGGEIDPAPGASDGGKSYGFFVTLVGRKRYFKVVATAASGTTGANFAATALLSRGKKSSDNATDRGLAGQAVVI